MKEDKLIELFDYAVIMRRKIHEYPEVGFELGNTVKLVRAELKKIGIESSTEYGRGSVVAEIGKGEITVAFRADMDALPIEENTDLPFKSKNPGKMHACGHDSHTAILLAAAKYLKENENLLKKKIRLIFQPSEEGSVSGAKMMVDNNIMDNVSEILCTHCDNAIESGLIGIHPGAYMAACAPITVRFYGLTSHAAIPEAGIDAIAMAHEAYGKFREAVIEEAGKERYIWSVGRLSGGEAHNVIADRCEMEISFRFYDSEFADRVKGRIFCIANAVAKRYGGRVEIDWKVSTGAVINDSSITNNFRTAAMEAGLNLTEMPQKMSSEDFAHYLTKAPGMIFRFGTRNKASGCTATAHRSDFKIDEEGMKTAIKAFCAYALYN